MIGMNRLLIALDSKNPNPQSRTLYHVRMVYSAIFFSISVLILGIGVHVVNGLNTDVLGSEGKNLAIIYALMALACQIGAMFFFISPLAPSKVPHRPDIWQTLLP